jgi:hypothetical protein
MRDHKAVNGIGPATGKSARDYLRERDARRASGQSQDARRKHPSCEGRLETLARMKRAVYALEYEMRADGEIGQ